LDEARRQINVVTRSKTLFQDGYTLIENPENAEVLITNEEGTVYTVSTLWETCSCLFFKKHGFCKHFLGWAKLRDDQTAYEEAQVACLEEEYTGRESGEGPNGCDYSDGSLSPSGCLW